MRVAVPRPYANLFGGLALYLLVADLSAAPEMLAPGSLAGVVRNPTGLPQMGAAVDVFNGLDALVQRVLTDEGGRFRFAALPPDTYTIRVSAQEYLPFLHSKITIQPGVQSLLTIRLNDLLGTIEFFPLSAQPARLLSDDWQWALRSNIARRPVLRFLPVSPDPTLASAPIFSDTRGLLLVSGGDAVGNGVSDLGTAFALETTIRGSNQLELSGNLGYGSRSGVPTAGFRARLTHSTQEFGVGPELTVTMRQNFAPQRPEILNDPSTRVPIRRSWSIGTIDHKQLSSRMRIDYGATVDSVMVFQRTTFWSPFARVSYAIAPASTIALAFSSGVTPTALLPPETAPASELQSSILALAAQPKVTLRDGSTRVEKERTFELGWRRVTGSRTYQAAVYHLRIANRSLLVSAEAGSSLLAERGNLLPNLNADDYSLNSGTVEGAGFLAAITQQFGSHLSFTVAGGESTGLKTQTRSLAGPSAADELRASFKKEQSPWVMARLRYAAPVSGTHFSASYGWTDRATILAPHASLTTSIRQETGLNLLVSQPISVPLFVPGSIELNAEVQNLLAQGYLPVAVADGRNVILIQSPRAIRGGISFHF